MLFGIGQGGGRDPLKQLDHIVPVNIELAHSIGFMRLEGLARCYR